MALLEDEGMTPDPSPFIGLFWPDLFKSLLCKAKTITNLGPEPGPDPALSAVDSSHMVFSEPTVENEVVPSPKLFLGIVQRHWASPGAGPPPSGTERKLYNVATAP